MNVNQVISGSKNLQQKKQSLGKDISNQMQLANKYLASFKQNGASSQIETGYDLLKLNGFNSNGSGKAIKNINDGKISVKAYKKSFANMLGSP